MNSTSEQQLHFLSEGNFLQLVSRASVYTGMASTGGAEKSSLRIPCTSFSKMHHKGTSATGQKLSRLPAPARQKPGPRLCPGGQQGRAVWTAQHAPERGKHVEVGRHPRVTTPAGTPAPPVRCWEGSGQPSHPTCLHHTAAPPQSCWVRGRLCLSSRRSRRLGGAGG